MGQEGSKAKKSILNSDIWEDEQLLTLVKDLEAENVTSDSEVEKAYQVSSDIEISMTLRQYEKNKVDQIKRHETMKQKLMEEITCLANSQVQEDKKEITILNRVNALKKLHKAIISEEEKLLAKDKKVLKKQEDKKQKFDIPASAKMAIQFAARTIMSLLKTSQSPQIMEEVCLIANDILAEQDSLALQDKFSKIPEISAAISSIAFLFSDILNAKIPCQNPQLALGPTLGIALAQGDLVSLLTVANYLVQNDVKLDTNMQKYAQKIKEIQGAVLPSVLELNWNPERLGPDIAISEENRVVTRTNSSSWGSQPTQQVLEGGFHYIEFFVRRNDSSCILLGVTKNDFTAWSGKCSGQGAFMLQGDGDLYHNDSRIVNLFSYSANDRIGLFLDLEEKTGQFYKNRTKQGNPVNIGWNVVRPTACFGSTDQFVELVQNPEIPEDLVNIIGARGAGGQQQQQEEKKDIIQQIVDREEYKANEEGKMAELNSHQLGLLIFASLSQNSIKFLKKYNLDQSPTGTPIQTMVLEKINGFNINLQAKTWELLNQFIQIDIEKNQEVLLCLIQILKAHLFSIKLGEFSDADVGLQDQLKNSINQRIQQFINSGNQMIKKEATLLFAHCFDVFTSKPVDQLRFINEGLGQDGNNNEFVNLLLSRFTNLMFLAPIFKKIQKETYQKQIETYMTILTERNTDYALKILNKQEVPQESLLENLLTFQRALFNLSNRKNEHVDKILHNYITLLLSNFSKCVNLMKEVSSQDQQLSDELLNKLQTTFLFKVISEFLCSLDIITLSLKGSGEILKQVFEISNILHQVNWNKNPKIEKQTTAQVDIVESPHPYNNNANETHLVKYPTTVSKVSFKFDPQCKTESTYDYLRLWTNEEEQGEPIKKFEGENWGEPIEFQNVSVLKFKFVSDGSTNYWGYKIEIETELSIDIKKVNWLTLLNNIVAYSLTQICKKLIAIQIPQQSKSLNNPFIANGVKDESLCIFLEENKCSEELVSISHKYLKAKVLGLATLTRMRSASASKDKPTLQKSITSKFKEITQQIQKEGESHSLDDYVQQLNSWKKQSYNYCSESFIEELLGSDKHDQWLEQLRVQSGLGNQRQKGEKAERAVFSVILLYTGQLYSAETYSTESALQNSLRFSNKIRTNIQYKRQKVLESNPDCKEDLYEKFTNEVVQKCVLLLNAYYHPVLNEMGFQRAKPQLNPLTLSSSQSTPPVFQQNIQQQQAQKEKTSAKDKWKKVRSQVQIMSKLKALVNLSKPIEQATVPKEEKTTEAKIASIVLEFVSEDEEAKQIAQQIIARRDIALSRAVGLTFLARILRENQSMLNYVSQAFNDAFFLPKSEGKGFINQHFLNGLQGVDWSLQQILRRSFFQVYKLLQNEIIEAKEIDFKESNYMVKTIEALSYPFEAFDSQELLGSRLSAFCQQLLNWGKGEIKQIGNDKQFQVKHVVISIQIQKCQESSLDENSVSLYNQKKKQELSEKSDLEQEEEEEVIALILKKGQANQLLVNDLIILDAQAAVPENYEKLDTNINQAAENEQEHKFLAFKRGEASQEGKYLVKVTVSKTEGLQISEQFFLQTVYKTYQELVEEVENKNQKQIDQRKLTLRKISWALLKLLFYGTSGSPEQHWEQNNPIKLKIQQMFVDKLISHLVWEPNDSKVEDFSTLAFNKDLASVDFKVQGSQEVEAVPNIQEFIDTLITVSKQKQEELESSSTCWIKRSIKEWKKTFGYNRIADQTLVQQVEQDGKMKEKWKNPKGQLDLFYFMNSRIQKILNKIKEKDKVSQWLVFNHPYLTNLQKWIDAEQNQQNQDQQQGKSRTKTQAAVIECLMWLIWNGCNSKSFKTILGNQVLVQNLMLHYLYGASGEIQIYSSKILQIILAEGHSVQTLDNIWEKVNKSQLQEIFEGSNSCNFTTMLLILSGFASCLHLLDTQIFKVFSLSHAKLLQRESSDIIKNLYKDNKWKASIQNLMMENLNTSMENLTDPINQICLLGIFNIISGEHELEAWPHPLQSTILNGQFGYTWHIGQLGTKIFLTESEQIELTTSDFSKKNAGLIEQFNQINDQERGDFISKISDLYQNININCEFDILIKIKISQILCKLSIPQTVSLDNLVHKFIAGIHQVDQNLVKLTSNFQFLRQDIFEKRLLKTVKQDDTKKPVVVKAAEINPTEEEQAKYIQSLSEEKQMLFVSLISLGYTFNQIKQGFATQDFTSTQQFQDWRQQIIEKEKQEKLEVVQLEDSKQIFKLRELPSNLLIREEIPNQVVMTQNQQGQLFIKRVNKQQSEQEIFFGENVSIAVLRQLNQIQSELTVRVGFQGILNQENDTAGFYLGNIGLVMQKEQNSLNLYQVQSRDRNLLCQIDKDVIIFRIILKIDGSVGFKGESHAFSSEIQAQLYNGIDFPVIKLGVKGSAGASLYALSIYKGADEEYPPLEFTVQAQQVEEEKKQEEVKEEAKEQKPEEEKKEEQKEEKKEEKVEEQKEEKKEEQKEEKKEEPKEEKLFSTEEVKAQSTSLTMKLLKQTGASKELLNSENIDLVINNLLSSEWEGLQFPENFENPIQEIKLFETLEEIDQSFTIVKIFGSQETIKINKFKFFAFKRASKITEAKKVVNGLKLTPEASEESSWEAQGQLHETGGFIYVKTGPSVDFGLTDIAFLERKDQNSPIFVEDGYKIASVDNKAFCIKSGDKQYMVIYKVGSEIFGTSAKIVSGQAASQQSYGLLDRFQDQGSEEETKKLQTQQEKDQKEIFKKMSSIEMRRELMKYMQAIQNENVKKALLKILPFSQSFVKQPEKLLTILSFIGGQIKKFPEILQFITSDFQTHQVLSKLLVQHFLYAGQQQAGEYKELIIESTHPYENNMRHEQTISIPGATSLKFEFEPECHTESGCDELFFYKQPGRVEELKKYSGRSFPNFEVEGDTIYLYFHSDGSCVEWGYKFKVIPDMPQKSDQSAEQAQFKSDLDYALWLLENINDSQYLQAMSNKLLCYSLTSLIYKQCAQDLKCRAISVLSKIIQVNNKNIPGFALESLLKLLANQSVILNEIEKQNPSKSNLLQALIEFQLVIQRVDEAFNKLQEAVQLTESIVSRSQLFYGLLFNFFQRINNISNEVVRESRHPYSKNPISKQILFRGAKSIEISFEKQTKLDDTDYLIFTYDKDATQPIQLNASAVTAEQGWQAEPKGPDITFSNNQKTVTRTNSSGWGCAIWECAYDSGKVSITWHIDSDGGSEYLYLGCYNSEQTMNLDDCPNSDKGIELYTWKKIGYLHTRGNSTQRSEWEFKTNDTVTLLMDFDEKKVVFSKNGVVMNTFESITANQLKPIVSFGGSNQVVSIISVEVPGAGLGSLVIPGDKVWYHFPVNIGYQLSRTFKWGKIEGQNKVTQDKETAIIKEDTPIYIDLKFAKAQYYIEFIISKITEVENLIFFLREGEQDDARYELNGKVEINQNVYNKESLQEGSILGIYYDGVQKIVKFYVNKILQIQGTVNAETIQVGARSVGTSFVKINRQVQIPQELDLLGWKAEGERGMSENWGFKLKATPVYTLEQKVEMLETLASKHQEAWTQFQEIHVKKFHKYADEQLVQLIDQFANKISKEPLQMKSTDLKPKSNDLVQFPHLDNCSEAEIRERFQFLQEINQKLSTLLNYVNLDIKDHPSYLQKIFLNARSYLFESNKNKTFNDIIGKTASGSRFSITVDRTKAAVQRGKGRCDTHGAFSVFGQLTRILQTKPNKELRQSDRVWEVKFEHEGSTDAGGPYNEMITNMSEELMSNFLPMFVPSPNQVHNTGTHRDCWMLNPGCNSATQKEMWICLGKLFGIAIRSANHLNLTLPPLFWKHLTLESVGKQDLKTIDECICQTVDIFKSLEGITKEEFMESFSEETFTTRDTAGRIVELKPDGRNIKLTYSNVKEYAALIEKVRLNEGKEIYEWVRLGMATVIPLSYLNLFTWKQVEVKVCGAPDIDTNKLKENTTYEGWAATDQTIVFFWQVFEEMTSVERTMFLRFVWGRSKLPSSGGFRQFKISKLNRGDEALPISHTCFFHIELPIYTNKDSLREKVLYAISHCTAIDLDNVATGGFEEE